ncbi:MAG: alpha-glucan family phosphorylase [Candidatus Omnitrophota bacterium]
MSGHSHLLKFAKIQDYDARYCADIHDDVYFTFPVGAILNAEQELLSGAKKAIAYFSMEYGLATNVYNVFKSAAPLKPLNKLSENDIISNERIADYLFSLKIDAALDLPIYSGGLGVLAGDTIKTAADLKMPMVAVGILWNKGYFKQRFWFKFGQLPEEMNWDPASFPGLIPLENKIKLELKDKNIYLRLWKYYVYSRTLDHAVPLILLDSNVEENDGADRKLTDRLYKSDDLDGRLIQRLVLGMGGMRALEELGYPLSLYHLNEGHAAFAFVQKARSLKPKDYDAAKLHFAYTCHTPVPAGHDRFALSDLERVLKPEDAEVVKAFGMEDKASDMVNLTILAMNTSRSINAVSKKHGEVMQLQFPSYSTKIKSITNGIHFATWVSEPILKVLDGCAKQLGDFRSDPTLLAGVAQLKDDDNFRQALWLAHQENKGRLSELLGRWKFKEDVLTIAWARRIAAYKRPSLIFQDIEHLIELARRIGPLQILYAGKAHPNDNLAFTYINDIMNTIDKAVSEDGLLKIVMLENYDIYIAKFLVSSVDIWLNNPLPPYEASGTSGMKAIANGVLQLSTVDGWVAEAVDTGIGKFFGYRDKSRSFADGLVLRLDEDSRALYKALEEMMNLYYRGKNGRAFDVRSPWIDMMIDCIVQAGHFNTSRMVREYIAKVWS